MAEKQGVTVEIKGDSREALRSLREVYDMAARINIRFGAGTRAVQNLNAQLERMRRSMSAVGGALPGVGNAGGGGVYRASVSGASTLAQNPQTAGRVFGDTAGLWMARRIMQMSRSAMNGGMSLFAPEFGSMRSWNNKAKIANAALSGIESGVSMGILAKDWRVGLAASAISAIGAGTIQHLANRKELRRAQNAERFGMDLDVAAANRGAYEAAGAGAFGLRLSALSDPLARQRAYERRKNLLASSGAESADWMRARLNTMLGAGEDDSPEYAALKARWKARIGEIANLEKQSNSEFLQRRYSPLSLYAGSDFADSMLTKGGYVGATANIAEVNRSILDYNRRMADALEKIEAAMQYSEENYVIKAAAAYTTAQ